MEFEVENVSTDVRVTWFGTFGKYTKPLFTEYGLNIKVMTKFMVLLKQFKYYIMSGFSRTDKASTQQAVYTVQAQVVESTFSSTFVATASVSAGILLIILASMSFWTKRYRSLHYKLNEY